MSLTSHPLAAVDAEPGEGLGFDLFGIADDVVDLGHAGEAGGSICAAQPVTMILASGRSRRARRIACRAWRTASAVTAQVLTITAEDSPAARACRA